MADTWIDVNLTMKKQLHLIVCDNEGDICKLKSLQVLHKYYL